jgi:hypothetical protein
MASAPAVHSGPVLGEGRFEVATAPDITFGPLRISGKARITPAPRFAQHVQPYGVKHTYVRRMPAATPRTLPELFAAPDIREFSCKPMASGVTLTLLPVAISAGSQR